MVSLTPAHASGLAAQPRLISRVALAKELGVSLATVERLVRDRQIPSVRLGTRRLFELEEVLRQLRRENEAAIG